MMPSFILNGGSRMRVYEGLELQVYHLLEPTTCPPKTTMEKKSWRGGIYGGRGA